MDYLKEIKKLEDKARKITDSRNQLINEWIKAEHPLKIGDIVEVTGYAHRGKKMIVDKLTVFVRDFLGSQEWRASGYVLKKNGEPGLQRGEWSQKIEEAK